MRLPAAVACSSWSTGAVAPTTTTLPRIAAASKWPPRTSLKDRLVTVPGGPRKSIQPPSSSAAGAGWRWSWCETTAAIVGRPLTWASVCRTTPSASAGRSEAATRSPMRGHGLVAAEHLRLAVGPDQRGGEDDRGVAAGGFQQGFVVEFVGRLVEGDVVHDQPRPRGVQAFDHAGVVAPGDRRPGKGAQALVVDAHDDHVAGRPLGAADREAGVDGVAVEPVGRGGEMHRQPGAGGDQGDRQQPEVPSLQKPAPHAHRRVVTRTCSARTAPGVLQSGSATDGICSELCAKR